VKLLRSLAPALVLAWAACAGPNGSPDSVTLTVLAASSLSNVMPAIGRDFTVAHAGVAVRFTFGGTDVLAADVARGAPADVFAGASSKYGEQLHSIGLAEVPHPFATNTLVLVVPPANPARISSPADLSRPGLKLVVGAPTVPVGSYTRTVLMNLDATYGAPYSSRVAANVVSNATNVEGVLAAVETGEADAGFVYVTDARAAGSQVGTITLPVEAQAVATYPIAAVTASRHRADAGAFVRFVLGPQARALLQAAGFGLPPAS
jgi:molybdate transport system substrate-binding protein